MQVLSQKESSALLSLLTGGQARTLASVGEAFATQFPKESARFRASCALGILLSELATGLKPLERIPALYCLLSQWNRPIGGNVNSGSNSNSQTHQEQGDGKGEGHPFERLLVDIVLNEELCGEVERELVFQWLVEGKTPGLNKEASITIEGFFNQTRTLPEERRQNVEVGLRRIRVSSELTDALEMIGGHGFGCFARAGIGRAVIDDGTNPVLVNPSGPSADLGALLPTQLGLSGFEPVFVRPPPPIMPPLDDELFWLTPSPPGDLVWDCGMGNDTSKDTEVHKLIKQALEGPLMPSQQKQVWTAVTWLTG